MKFRWTFEREAWWMVWLFLAVPAIGMLVAIVLPAIFRALGW